MLSLKLLATDLDGTLIPLSGNQQNKDDLQLLAAELSADGLELAFVTGRHLASVEVALHEFELPSPSCIVCDVGTSIYVPDNDSGYQLSEQYSRKLRSIVQPWTTERLHECLKAVEGLRKQESEKQTEFKLSYYVEVTRLSSVLQALQVVLKAEDVPFAVVSSVDPFTGDGLVDLLPVGVNKAFAVNELLQIRGLEPHQAAFAGDSGNDLAVFCSGVPSILVANTHADVVEQARECHRRKGWSSRLYVAEQEATSGVLEGIRYYRHRH